MPDDLFTDFLLALCTNRDDLLTKYVANRAQVVDDAKLTTKVKTAFEKAFAAEPKVASLRFQIQNTQGKGGGKPTAKRTAAKKTAKKVAKGAKKR